MFMLPIHLTFRRYSKFIFVLGVFCWGGVFAADPKKVDVRELKKQYWSQDQESDVVQNRIYAKSQRMEFGILGGTTFSDPFLSTNNFGFSLGYHFTEYLSAHLVGWRAIAKGSSALTRLEQQTGSTTNTNPQKRYISAEMGWNFIYGKLSLMGKSILYYDFHVLAGGGRMETESGNYVGLHVGVGQQIYLSNSFAIRMDYRLVRYGEDLIEKINTATKGQVAEHRTNYSNTLALGLSYFFL